MGMKRKDTSDTVNGPVLYCGDPHGQFRHIVEAASHNQASAVILLGDMDAERMLEVELAPIRDRTWFIPGNHDTDTDSAWCNLWGSALADRNMHGRVVELPDGTRIAGLGGVFRGAVWMPTDTEARFRSRAEHTNRTPRQDRFGEGPHRKHWSSIYPDEFVRLAMLRADVLVTHEAPGYHPHGFEILDTLAQSLGARIVVHGHHHDSVDSSTRWATQGFKSFGVGLRGITAIDADGQARVIVPGELDGAPDSCG
jgi:predicted phosphodiesterase